MSFMFIPSIDIVPSVTSKNLGIRLTMVLLPEPVEPISAVVVPFSAVKLILVITS